MYIDLTYIIICMFKIFPEPKEIIVMYIKKIFNLLQSSAAQLFQIKTLNEANRKSLNVACIYIV